MLSQPSAPLTRAARAKAATETGPSEMTLLSGSFFGRPAALDRLGLALVDGTLLGVAIESHGVVIRQPLDAQPSESGEVQLLGNHWLSRGFFRTPLHGFLRECVEDAAARRPNRNWLGFTGVNPTFRVFFPGLPRPSFLVKA